jgi:hypothetical protein
MPRTVFLSLALAATASVAHAQNIAGTHKWDGAMRFVNQSAACNAQFASPDNNRAFFHLLADGNSSFSSITRFGNGQTELILPAANAQFNGTGEYWSFKIAYGFFSFPLFGNGPDEPGTYNLTQTPAVVTPATNYISLSGTLQNYYYPGCTLTVQGYFVRVEMDEVPPPPPPY